LPFLCSSAPAGPLDRPSFPTRRSSDLIVGRNPDIVGHVPFNGGQYFAAMNTADYNAAAMCGACVEVSRDDGRKVQAMVVDQCPRSEEHTSELQSRENLVCRLLLEKKKN